MNFSAKTWGVLLPAIFCAGFAHAESDRQQFAAALRESGYFRLGEVYCRNQLGSSELTILDRGELVRELVKTHTAHAINLLPEQREPQWQAAFETLTEFRKQHAEYPQPQWLDLQEALTWLARGELRRMETEVVSSGTAGLEAARADIRQATRLLSELAEKLKLEIPRRRSSQQPGELSAEELTSLAHHVQFQLARAYRNQALCYEADSADRVASLTQAVEALRQPLTQLAAEDHLAWELRRDLAESYRLLGDLPSARAMLKGADKGPPELQRLLRAELARIELAAGSAEKAMAVLALQDEAVNRPHAEFDFAILETQLALWQEAQQNKQEEAAQAWQQRAVATVDSMKKLHGLYWGRRAERLLVKTAGSGSSDRNIDLLARTAEELYRQGEFDEAIAAFDQAAAKAEQAQAFDLAYKAALVEQHRKRHAAAAVRFQQAALKLREHEQASRAHLLAAWNMAQAARESPELLPEYAALLEAQLDLWPQAAVSNQARLWLARLREREEAAAAIELYLAVEAESPSAVEARQEALRLAEALLASSGEGTTLQNKAWELANQFSLAIKQTTAEDWSPADRLTAIGSAKLRLVHAGKGHAEAERLLAKTLADLPDPPPQWTAEAQALLVIAQAGQPERRAKALETLESLAGASPAALFNLAAGLHAVAGAAGSRAQGELAPLQLQALALLKSHLGGLSQPQQQEVRIMQAAALQHAGRRGEAEAQFEKLAQDFPRDGNVQSLWGEFLLAGKDAASAEKALAQWRLIASRSRPQTDIWWQAKYHVASLLVNAGQKEDARKLLLYLRETPPGWSASGQEEAFELLLRRCE